MFFGFTFLQRACPVDRSTACVRDDAIESSLPYAAAATARVLMSEGSTTALTTLELLGEMIFVRVMDQAPHRAQQAFSWSPFAC